MRAARQMNQDSIASGQSKARRFRPVGERPRKLCRSAALRLDVEYRADIQGVRSAWGVATATSRRLRPWPSRPFSPRSCPQHRIAADVASLEVVRPPPHMGCRSTSAADESSWERQVFEQAALDASSAGSYLPAVSTRGVWLLKAAHPWGPCSNPRLHGEQI